MQLSKPGKILNACRIVLKNTCQNS